jgi:hypothetical protein
LKQLAQVWLDDASKLDGLPPTGAQAVPSESTKVAHSAD